jgi:hypothetical protein
MGKITSEAQELSQRKDIIQKYKDKWIGPFAEFRDLYLLEEIPDELSGLEKQIQDAATEEKFVST